MKSRTFKKILAAILIFCLCFAMLPANSIAITEEKTAPLTSTTNELLNSEEQLAFKKSELPQNIGALVEGKGDREVFLYASAKTADGELDPAELYTIREENPITGEGTLIVHSNPVKFVDSSGNLKFIDTGMKATNGRSDFLYENAANSFSVQFAGTADKGINFNNAFTVGTKSEYKLSKAGTIGTADSHGKIVYPEAFGAETKVEYINTENGIKENIILNEYTGQNRFEFIFRSDTHIPTLANNGANILISKKDNPQEAEYKFLSLYAYDSYQPSGEAKKSDFRHMNEELYYELKENSDGSYTITVVVPEEYLTHPEIVYPVTIDPSVTHTSSNSNAQDTFVDAATPSTQSNSGLDYIRFGKKSGYKMYGYFRFTSLPSLSSVTKITDAYIRFTFRNGQNTPAASTGVQMRTRTITSAQWSESSITWNNKPSGDSGLFSNLVYNGNYLNYFNSDVTWEVRDWYSGDAPNYGINFTYSDDNYNDYNSVVSSEGDSSRAPKLTITYEGVSVTSVSVSPTSLSLNNGAQNTLTATVSPTNATNKTVSWSVNNSDIAYVNTSGCVLAKKPGTAVVTVTTADGNKTATCSLSVNPTSSDYTAISNGGTYSYTLKAGEHKWYKFTPATSGSYSFSTTGAYDVVGELYQGTTHLVTNDDGGQSNNFAIERNLTAGTEYRLKVRCYSATATATYTLKVIKGDANESSDNVYSGATVAEMGQTISNHKISYAADEDWYKVSVPTHDTYRLRVLLYKPNGDNGGDKPDIQMGIYTGSSANTLVGAAVCRYDDRPASATAQIDHYSGSQWFYIAVKSYNNEYSVNNNYQISFTYTDEPYGGEIYGWDYSGSKKSPTINYRLSDGMNDVWKVQNGVSITYEDLFREAIDRWNNADVKGDGKAMFAINDSLFSSTVKAVDLLTDSTAVNYKPSMNIELNRDDFENNPLITYEKAINIICHELGHSLGLADLYINNSYGYTYVPPGSSTAIVLDNRNHMMYGYWNTQNLGSNGTNYLHSNDIFGVGKVQGWYSSKSYTIDELYSNADLIVRGSIKNVQDYNNELYEGAYSRVWLNIDEYLYCSDSSRDKTISFLQNGNSDIEFAVDPLCNIGEEYVLFLKYNFCGELILVGGAQGKFKVIEQNGASKIINQVDLYVQNTMALALKQQKDFSISKDSFLSEAIVKIERGKQNK